MFGDDERLRLGQIKHLTGGMADTRVRPKARTARAGRRVMIDNVVRIRDLSQGLALVTLLPAPLLAGAFPQALHPYRLLQSIARRRLAPLFELFNPSRRSSSAIRAFSDAFSALSAPISAISSSPGRLAFRFANYSILIRKPVRLSREIYRQFTSRSPNLGSNFFS